MSRKITQPIVSQSGGETGGQKLYQHVVRFTINKTGYVGLYTILYVRWILPQSEPFTEVWQYCQNPIIKSHSGTPLLTTYKFDKDTNHYYLYHHVNSSGSGTVSFWFWDVEWSAENGLSISNNSISLNKGSSSGITEIVDTVTELKES